MSCVETQRFSGIGFKAAVPRSPPLQRNELSHRPSFPVPANVPYSIKESRLQKEFANFGEIAEVKLVRDEFTKRSKGYAFIQYTSQDEAMVAVENMDRQVFDGRMIHVEIAKLGKDRVRGCPKTSGPPSSKPQLQQPNDVADCWY
ncbi:hypothetical protein V6N12_056122 [Hibiscus sabdariffa]|uniref:RRM domain-containing protein n=1 Tax=Hibiscus sabdariffa TaxID=183260 RepID=A0ABR2CRM2_9ROSI